MSLVSNSWVRLMQLQGGFCGFSFFFFERRENMDFFFYKVLCIKLQYLFLKDVLLLSDLFLFHTYTNTSCWQQEFSPGKEMHDCLLFTSCLRTELCA